MEVQGYQRLRRSIAKDLLEENHKCGVDFTNRGHDLESVRKLMHVLDRHAERPLVFAEQHS